MPKGRGTAPSVVGTILVTGCLAAFLASANAETPAASGKPGTPAAAPVAVEKQQRSEKRKPQPASSRQQSAKPGARASEVRAASPDTDEVALLKQQLSLQQRQIEQLRMALDAQKQMLEQALQTTQSPAAQAPNLGQVASLAPVLPAGSAGTEARVSASPLPATAPAATEEQIHQYTAKVDDLGKKLDGVVKTIGGFKLSGDLRFRTDGIFRSGNKVAGPQQNIRERYRLRLNVDKSLNDQFGFHMQLSLGPANNPLTFDTDFGGITTRQPFLVSEVFADYHPTKNFSFRGGRMPEVFADNSRFLLDDDVRFNGFQEVVKVPLRANALGIKSVELRAGQYILSNPNVQILSVTSPYVSAGFTPGGNVRASDLFHEGFAVLGDISRGWSHQLFADIQWYRNPNEIALASTSNGFPVLVNGTFGLGLSGALSGTGNATTTPDGAIFSAPNFQVARLNYRITHKGWKLGDREMPAWLDFQVSRNLSTGKLRDAVMATANLGEVKKLGDLRLLYIFSIKDANAMISQLTDDDLGTGTGVNIATHHLRLDLGLTSFLQWQNLLFIQDERRPSEPKALFFVPLQRGAATQYRVQSQFQFTF